MPKYTSNLIFAQRIIVFELERGMNEKSHSAQGMAIMSTESLPLILEALDRVVNAKIYTKFDICAAYNRI